MFSGITQTIGTVQTTTEKEGGKEFVIDTNSERSWKQGESVLVSGICSTVTAVRGGLVTVFYMPETLQKTTATQWAAGSVVNIEHSLALGDEISGHLVFGHVDGIATVDSIESDGESKLFWFTAPEELTRYLVPKGSVALNGVSLTVIDVTADKFSVSLIPFTLEHTTFGKLQVGDKLNFEADMLAKYVEKLVAPYAS
jgi:riboflavin synthase